MPRYIDADEAVKAFEECHGSESTLLNCYNADWIVSFLEYLPSADVQEVRHGRWIYCGKPIGYDHRWQCSECLRLEFTKHKADIKDYPYCHCGAKMDGEG